MRLDSTQRRLQAAVIFVTTLLAVGTGTMALTLIAQTRDPYQLAFDAQKGAHLKVAFDGRIDPGTYTPLPWKPALARFAADLYVDQQPHPYCPRVNLKRLLAENRLRPFFLFEAVPTRIIKASELTDIDPGLMSLRNLNTPADYEDALRQLTRFVS